MPHLIGKKYRREANPIFRKLILQGYGGYEFMDKIVTPFSRWNVIPHWGSKGWNLGSWPLVMIFAAESNETFELMEYVEGDITYWVCPMNEIRENLIDRLAFYWWKKVDAEWVSDYDRFSQLPDELTGPYRP